MVEQDFNGEFLPEKHDPTRNVPLWAKERAREWCERYQPHAVHLTPGESYTPKPEHEGDCHRANCAWPYRVDSLAALLMEVRREAQIQWAPSVRADVLAEVRRVVNDVLRDSRERPGRFRSLGILWACDEILARLEGLIDTPRLSTESEAKVIMGDGQPLIKMREIR